MCAIDADSACYTLGYTSGGTYSTYDMTEWSEPEIPFLMDNVWCESASTNFLSCSSIAESCDHTRDVFLRCFSSGKTSCKSYFMLRLKKLVSPTHKFATRQLPPGQIGKVYILLRIIICDFFVESESKSRRFQFAY